MTRLLPLLAIMALFLASVTMAHAQATTPAVSTVAITSDPGTDDTYALGDTIEVGLTFDEAVTVTGAPYLLIDVGGTNQRASYQSGSTTAQLLFRYTVLAGDDDDDGIGVVTNSLTLNGGTIVATDDATAAILDHAALTTTDHKVDIISELVSNFGQTEASNNVTISATSQAELVITVGDNDGGFQLDSVVLDVKSTSETLDVEVKLYDPLLYPNVDGVLGTLTGSVKTAGRQTFTLSEGDNGNLLIGDWLYLVVSGTGTGTVELGLVVGRGLETGVSEGWFLHEGTSSGTNNYLKFAFNGHEGAIPYLLSASIYSMPYDQTTFTAGERIEIDLRFSEEVQLLDESHTLRFRLGTAGDQYREAELISVVSYRAYFAYTVQPADPAADGVLLETDVDVILTRDGETVFANVFNSNVRSEALRGTDVQTSASLPVDGTQARVCEVLFCGYMDVEWGFPTFFFDQFIFNPWVSDWLNSTSFEYAGEEHNISFIVSAVGSETRYDRVELYLDFQRAPLRRLIDRAVFHLGSLELPLRDAERSIVANEWVSFRWGGVALDPADGSRFSVKIVENVDVSFGSDTYTVAEDGSVEVELTLNADLERDATVPITVVNQDGATDQDYTTVPTEVSFLAGETTKSFVITPVDDEVDDDDETLKVLFGTLPENLSPGTTTETVVTIVDNDDPQVEVNFRRAIHDVAEGASQAVTVKLTADPERTVVIPLTATDRDGATSADYAALPASVTFEPGDTSKTFTFTATDDAIDDDGERVVLGFGTLPDGVTPGTVPTSTVSIIDDDAPASVAVSWAQTAYSVSEGGSVTVTAELDDDPEKTVVVPIARTDQGGADSGDYSGVPVTITFESGDTSKTFTFTATDDAQDDDDESVQLAFGPTLPSGVTQGTPASTLVRITDNDDPQVKASYGLAEYTAAEGSSVTVTVELDADPERTVVIPVTHTARAGATNADYSVVPESVTFDAGETEQTFTFTATDDTVDDDDESVLLAFGTLPTGITAGTVQETVVRIDDDDDPDVKVSFAHSSYTAPEGATVSVVVELDADPERSVTIPIASTPKDGASNADYSVPDGVTFAAGETAKAVAFTATMDAQDDDGESVQLAFGPALPSGVTQGTPSTTTVSITDDDLAGDRLTSLVVAPRDIDGFDPEVTGYMVGVASTVTQATITATPGQTDATIAIDGTAVTAGSAHAVDLSAGLNTFEVVVTSADNTQTTYTVYIGRGTTDQGGWKAGDDLDTLRAAGNTEPSGIWSNGTTIWIADVSTAKLYAYSQAGGARNGDKDIALGAAMMAPTGVWSDGATMWVIGPVEMTAVRLHPRQRRPGFGQRYQPGQ